MTELLTMPRVSECTVTSCAYNHDGCRAFAVTIGPETAECATYVETSAHGASTR